MLKVEYCEQGNMYSDFNLLKDTKFIIDQYKKIVNQGNKDVVIKVSTNNIIQALRVLVSRGELSFDEIIFVFNEYEITINSKFELTKYPKGFMDWEQNFLYELVKKKIGKI